MTNILELRTLIENKLKTLTWTWKPIAVVFDYHTLENNWEYPYITFEPASLSWEYLDTKNNLRTYVFDIFIYQEIVWRWRDKALEVLLNAFKQVVQAVDEDFTLGWKVDWWIEASSWDFWQIVSWDWKILFANIKLSCKIIVDIS